MSDYRFPSGPVWKFETKNFVVELHCERIHRYQYDGDDENGETQRKIDEGEWHAFESGVRVWLKNDYDSPIGEDWLYGSVYDDPREFWTAHRDPDPMNRNCSMQPENVVICHYFPGMVKQAIAVARHELKRRRDSIPYFRESACD